MKILLCSYWFFPSFGGVETVSKILAEEFTKAGASVTVVTDTPAGTEEPIDVAYSIVRRPTRKQLFTLARQSDVILQNMISLRFMASLVFSGKPIFILHQSWMRRHSGKRGPENYVKLFFTQISRNISISHAIADSLPKKSTIIGNPFESAEFETLRTQAKDRDIVFMGRLVSDKGCDLLLRALALLKAKGLRPSLTIIGDGPESSALKASAANLGIADQIEFAGAMREGRGQLVARHKIMAVPSTWAEPFGIVALEGIASGCAIIASASGGLKDSVGPCGLFFPNGDAAALATALQHILEEPGLREALVAKGPEHLEAFQPAHIAERFLTLFRNVTPTQFH
jgi:glycogen(starch) synthase